MSELAGTRFAQKIVCNRPVQNQIGDRWKRKRPAKAEGFALLEAVGRFRLVSSSLNPLQGAIDPYIRINVIFQKVNYVSGQDSLEIRPDCFP